LENLQHGLLNQAVDDTGDAEFPDSAIAPRDLGRFSSLTGIAESGGRAGPVAFDPLQIVSVASSNGTVRCHSLINCTVHIVP
jgi:hypothetical protein